MGAIVLAIRTRDGEMMFNPPADTAIHAGDHLIVMGRPEHLRTLEHLAAEARARRLSFSMVAASPQLWSA